MSVRLAALILAVLSSGAFALLADASRARAEGPADRLSILGQAWHQDGKFLVVDITFQNDNSFPLKGVIVSCDIKGDKAKPNDSRGMTIRQVLPPGKTRVPGLEFTITGTSAEGGACKVASAEKNS